jgi:predicted DNA-binding transcriptional regulator AlpA|tara:strand:+ start:1881 stop:2105 length:225 start_codon:yes stop_codon:yes gene_type:complete
MSKENKVVNKLLEGVRLMRMKQISAYTSLSKPYLYKLISEGDFPNPVFVNGIRVWEKENIDQWLESKFNGGQPC